MCLYSILVITLVICISGKHSRAASNEYDYYDPCEAFYNATARSLDYLVYMRYSDGGDVTKEGLRDVFDAYLGIDIFNAGQVKQLSCSILEANTVKEIVGLIGPWVQQIPDQQLQSYYDLLEAVLDNIFDETQTYLVELSTAKGWALATGYPNLPVDMTYSQVLRSLENVDWYVLDRLGLGLRYDKTNMIEVAKALVESKSDEEFAKRTHNFVDIFRSDVKQLNTVDEHLKGLQAMQNAVAVARSAKLFSLPFE